MSPSAEGQLMNRRSSFDTGIFPGLRKWIPHFLAESIHSRSTEKMNRNFPRDDTGMDVEPSCAEATAAEPWIGNHICSCHCWCPWSSWGATTHKSPLMVRATDSEYRDPTQLIRACSQPSWLEIQCLRINMSWLRWFDIFLHREDWVSLDELTWFGTYVGYGYDKRSQHLFSETYNRHPSQWVDVTIVFDKLHELGSMLLTYSTSCIHFKNMREEITSNFKLQFGNMRVWNESKGHGSDIDNVLIWLLPNNITL